MKSVCFSCPNIKASVLATALLASAICLNESLLGQIVSSADSSSQAQLSGSKEYDQPVDPEFFLVRPAEKLTVTFIGSKVPSLELTVDPEGRVIHSSLGIIQLSGLTLSQAREKLIPVLKKLFTAESIEISISSPRQVGIHVSGAVERPGLYRAFMSQHLSEVIAMAGGVSENGSRRRVEFRGGAKTLIADLDKAEFMADASADFYVYAGSAIHVPEKSVTIISVVGEVTHPRSIELVDDDNLTTLISLAGGVTQSGDASKAYVLDGNGSLKAGAIIIVPPAADAAVQSNIHIFGAVHKQGRIPFSNQMTLGSAFQLAENFTAPANSGRVTVFRRLPADEWGAISAQRYAISTADASGKLDVSFPLQADDSVFVPKRKTVVTLEGEIALPGNYLHTEGKSASYYINLAGGFLASADKTEISIYDRITRQTTRQSVGVIIRDGDKIVVLKAPESK
jgi:protein involved in polysaccharide export with SLBB domain